MNLISSIKTNKSYIQKKSLLLENKIKNAHFFHGFKKKFYLISYKI